ncbi:MAG: hypothetical protein JO171_19545 [Paludibacterium sp.]|uniref:hypothetical protein n=1 Tax=Paludibacterium sp. TaxID=1917523 RepID=UPI0025CF93DB|nr:hypothetical protein [Paludibacterium sp.]MBV8049352.1 hypothetical protein [Paludibacterium sp.]MBV8649473.1 hypothetical protein [Paludibacterium sp.]
MAAKILRKAWLLPMVMSLMQAGQAADSLSAEAAGGQHVQMQRLGVQWHWDDVHWWQTDDHHVGAY